MKAVIQRVLRASVTVDGKIVGSIERGILTLLGIQSGDTPEVARKMVERILKLRIFEDSSGKMNHSIREISGAHLMVSQFTLLGDLSKGNRPSFMEAGSAEQARSLFEQAVVASRESGIPTQTGVFQADMKVELVNDGPATFLLEEGLER